MPAVMDDSLVKANGIYVYAHAIVSDVALPQTLAFVGTPKDLYTREDEIIAFILRHHDDPFYACEHYRSRYKRVKEHITGFINHRSRISRALHKLHVQADQLARSTAWDTLDAALHECFYTL